MATSCSAPVWANHHQGGITYGLGHLRPRIVRHVLPAVPAVGKKPGRAEMQAMVYLHYSHHCFSQAPGKVLGFDPDHVYTDTSRNESRIFCPVRWQQSQHLPALISRMMGGKCWFTRHHNYFLLEPIAGQDDPYTIYFAATRHESAGLDVDVHVESAYCKPKDQPQGKISFNAIVANVMRGKTPRAPPR